MFTGLVDHLGTILSAGVGPGGGRVLRIASSFADFSLGESIACDGVCLTVERAHGGRTGGAEDGTFEVTAGEETLKVTTLGAMRPGDRLHLERALRVGDRLGGHLVQGHVDGVGEVVAITPGEAFTRVVFTVPEALARYVAPKGSVTVDGVSLTVNEVSDTTFTVGLVPHTLKVTKMGSLKAGSRVNLETDLLARYLARLAGFDAPAPSSAHNP